MPINHNTIAEKPKKETVYVVEDPFWTFDDVILSEETKDEIENAIAVEENKELIFDTWKLGQVMKRKRSLSMNLYGLSGTGKTMTAHAIAHHIGKKIVIMDYAEIESKYVGETSKNLVSIFEFTKENQCLLVFDEADALLSKRVTSMNNATDVSVNQTRNVLLKILDTCEIPVIFTTNFIQNYDEAFFRRISYHIKFDLPNKGARIMLWNHYLVDGLPIEERDNLIESVSDVDGTSGAEISNIVLDTAIGCARGKYDTITKDVVHEKLMKLIEFKAAKENFEVKNEKISKDEAEGILGRRL